MAVKRTGTSFPFHLTLGSIIACLGQHWKMPEKILSSDIWKKKKKKRTHTKNQFMACCGSKLEVRNEQSECENGWRLCQNSYSVVCSFCLSNKVEETNQDWKCCHWKPSEELLGQLWFILVPILLLIFLLGRSTLRRKTGE